MKPKTIMLIAGEPSGDMLGAELVRELRKCLPEREPVASNDAQPLEAGIAPRFFGAGGPLMAAAGVELAVEMTRHSVIGLVGVLIGLPGFKRRFRQLYELAMEKRPDAIVCIDFAGFNRRFAAAVASYVRTHTGPFHDWRPKLIQYVSPQIWASREGRAIQMERDYDLLLSIFPFERELYSKIAPRLRVEFVGNPVVDRITAVLPARSAPPESHISPVLLLFPGSRRAEVRRHLPVILSAMRMLKARVTGLRAIMVLPDEVLLAQAKSFGVPPDIEVRCGGLADALRQATLALSKTGTIIMECAAAGVPAVTFYKTSWFEYQGGRLIVKVKYLTMVNILAGEPLFPEFVQADATPGNIAATALRLLEDEPRRKHIHEGMAKVIASLGPPGASRRAAEAIGSLLYGPAE
jgi:lipid-A-disaccharide synthase